MGAGLRFVPAGDDGVMTHGRIWVEGKGWQERETRLSRYVVMRVDERLGVVSLYKANIEQRARGARYVSRRWDAPRWSFMGGGRSGSGYETRKRAVAALLLAISG